MPSPSSAPGAEGCGGFNFGEGLTQSMVEAHASEDANLIIDFLHPVGNDIRYVLATLDRPEGRVTLALAVGASCRAAARNVRRGRWSRSRTCRRRRRRAPPALAAALRIQGRIALYGIHFASEKATIRRDSRPLLEQVSRMLLADPAMRLIVVGHSDTSGTLAHALELSAARAQAVVQALETDWKVPAAQLTSLGGRAGGRRSPPMRTISGAGSTAGSSWSRNRAACVWVASPERIKVLVKTTS